MGDENEVKVDGTEQVNETDDVLISPEQVKEVQAKYDELIRGIEESYTGQTKAVEGAYGKQIEGVADFLKEAGEEKNTLTQNDAEQARKANAYRYITGVGDALSGIANLVGTTKGAVSQQQHYNAPGIMQQAEALRKERKLEMDKLNARIDELTAQKTALEATKEMKLGELSGKKAAEKLKAKLQKATDETSLITTNTKARTDLTRTAMDNATDVMVAEINSGKPSSTKKTQGYVPVQTQDGSIEYVKSYKGFEDDYKKALDRAVAQGTSGMTAEEIEQYKLAKDAAATGDSGALKVFFDFHTYRDDIVKTMKSNPIYNSLP